MNDELQQIYQEEIIAWPDNRKTTGSASGCCSLCDHLFGEKSAVASAPSATIATGITSADVMSQITDATVQVDQWHSGAVLFLSSEPGKHFNTMPISDKLVTWKTAIDNAGFIDRGVNNQYWQDFKYAGEQELFAAAVKTFQLRNAIFTYLRKCQFETAGFPSEFFRGNKEWRQSATTCFETFLLRELNLLKPKVVFCIEMDVRNALLSLLSLKGIEPSFEIVSLPKPSYSRLLGFRQAYFKHAIFGMLAEGLVKSGVLTPEFAARRFGEWVQTHASLSI